MINGTRLSGGVEFGAGQPKANVTVWVAPGEGATVDLTGLHPCLDIRARNGNIGIRANPSDIGAGNPDALARWWADLAAKANEIADWYDTQDGAR